MKKKGIKNLTYTQRTQIETLNNAGHSKSEIAKYIGVSIRTIFREFNRGAYRRLNGDTWTYFKSYSANIAHERYKLACTSKGRPLKIGNDFEFVRYMEHRVNKDKISPCAVLGQIKRDKIRFKTQISKTTLYRYIEQNIFTGIRLNKKQKNSYRKVMKKAPKGTSIEKRPLEIKCRNTFGHWEMDCLCGSSRATWLMLTERLTRKEIIFKMPNQKAESVIKCLNSLEKKFGKKFKQVFKTITVDNGVEFSNFVGMEKSIYGRSSKRTSVYYCHPYCSCERGSNERLNREVRRLVPKGSDLSKYTDEEVKQIENWVNNYPRQVLGFATSKELFDNHLRLIV